MESIRADDADGARLLLDRDPELRTSINGPIGHFDSPALNSARSRAMIDVLLAAGADINAKSQWWAGGFGFLHTCDVELAEYAIDCAAVVDVHAASRLGRLDRLREIIEADPESVHARGDDGQTPLHFARTVEIAAYLLDHGADIDALDIDHESTPAQWMLGDRVEVARANSPLDDAENDFDATPIGWATHGSEHGWHRRTGNFPAVVEALLEAGAKLPATVSGTDAVKEVLRRHSGQNGDA
jgi:hypothetical protein